MFTGLVQAVGYVAARSDGCVRIQAPIAPDLTLGESVCVSGICLTVTQVADQTFDVDVSPTTDALTTASGWQVGTRVNLERALALGDRLGGHLVTGHVDGTATLLERLPSGNSERLRFESPGRLAPHLVERGSIAVDGVSLTLNEIADLPGADRVSDQAAFWVTIIPQTADKTTLSDLARGARVNIETDLLGKYVERMLGLRGSLPVVARSL